MTCWTPLDGVNLLLVGLEVVDAGVLLHGPDLEGHVVAAAGQELALGVPLDRVHLVRVPLDRYINSDAFAASF